MSAVCRTIASGAPGHVPVGLQPALARKCPPSTGLDSPIVHANGHAQRLRQIDGDHLIRRDLHPGPLPAHSGADLLKYLSTIRSEQLR